MLDIGAHIGLSTCPILSITTPEHRPVLEGSVSGSTLGFMDNNTTDFFVLSITDSNLRSSWTSIKTSFSLADMLNGTHNNIKKHIKL